MDKGRIRVPAVVGDWAIAAGVAALLLGTGRSGEAPGAGPDLLGYALLAASGLALAARRRAPLVVLAVTGLCAVGYQAAGFHVLAVSYLVAVYGAVRAGHRALTAAASVTMLVALRITALVVHDGPVGEALAQGRGVLEFAWLIAAFAAGEAVRQAERRADEAERSREETARRRADEERLHIARELHDSLTHQISIIKVQSEVAVHVARKRGEQVPDSLLAIQEAGREATRELRATLQALRDDDTTPPRGLDHIPELVERAGWLRPGGDADHRRTAARCAYRGGPDRLPDRPGVAHQHRPARGRCHRVGPDRLPARRPRDTHRRRRQGHAGQRADTRPRAARHARTRHRPGRPASCAGPRSERGFTVQAELPVEQMS